MSYTAVDGDSLWRIYERNKAKGNTYGWGDYEKANPEFTCGKTMHPGDSVNIPQKLIPDETEIQEPVVEQKEPVEKVKEAVDDTPNEPDNHTDASNCCCMVAPWTIEEEGRDYTLYVTKEAEEKLSDKTIKVSKKEISNVRIYRETLKDFIMNSSPPIMTYEEVKRYLSPIGYELQIVSPKKGSLKKVILKYEFLKKNCEKNMLLESIQGKMVLKKDKAVEINSLGKIKGKFLPNDTDKQNKYIDIDKLSDWEIILGALFSPKKIVNKVKIYPVGKTCEHQPIVNLFIFPSMKIDGTLAIKYKPNFKTKKYITDEFHKTERNIYGQAKIDKNNFINTTKEWTITSGIYGYYGDRTISYDTEKVFGGKETEKTLTRQKTSRKGIKRKTTFTPTLFLNTVDNIFDIFKRANNAGGRFLNVEMGDIGFSLSVKNYKFMESAMEYNVDYEMDLVLILMFFNNTKVKIDIVELILLYVSRGGQLYKMLSDGRQKLSEGIHDKSNQINFKPEVIIELGFFGGTIAYVKVSKKMNKPIELTDAKASPRVGLIVKAVVKVELKIYLVEAGGELGGIGASVDKATVPSQLKLDVGIEIIEGEMTWKADTSFSGLAIYGMWKAYVKVKESEKSSWLPSFFRKTDTSMSGHIKPIILAKKRGNPDAVAVGVET